MSYKIWIFIAVFLFGTGIAFGLATSTDNSLPSEYITAFEEQFSGILTLPKPLIALFILLKNTSALLISFALSPIFCLVPVLALFINGLVIAFVSTLVIEEESLGFLLAGLLPHGVFELPALILGQAAALSFGTTAVLALFKKERRNLLIPSLKRNLKYLMVALALLLPAAIIETYITPLLLS
ncbi:MAG: stage II sporulation protein M [Dehalococcoidales bacterium]|nr:stage II sporulation protein M [Dehalococcoidales bacterium]